MPFHPARRRVIAMAAEGDYSPDGQGAGRETTEMCSRVSGQDMTRFAFPGCAAALLSAALLAGCTTEQHRFPSLAPRPIEALAPRAVEAPVAPTPPGTSDAALDAQAAAARALAEGSVAPFDGELADARRAIEAARGASPQSEAWIRAQQAITRADGARGPATQALSDLDRLRLDAAKRAEPLDTSALDAAWERAAAIEADQRARFDAVAAALPAP